MCRIACTVVCIIGTFVVYLVTRLQFEKTENTRSESWTIIIEISICRCRSPFLEAVIQIEDDVPFRKERKQKCGIQNLLAS